MDDWEGHHLTEWEDTHGDWESRHGHLEDFQRGWQGHHEWDTPHHPDDPWVERARASLKPKQAPKKEEPKKLPPPARSPVNLKDKDVQKKPEKKAEAKKSETK